MTEMDTQLPFQLGEWTVHPDSCRLVGVAGEVKLEPKVMKVLVCLAGQPGKVISREQLEEMAWAGTVVGYDAVSGSVIKLRKALGDNSKSPRYIETISKKGYRLIAKVGDVGETAGPTTVTHPSKHKRHLFIAAVVAVIAMLVWTVMDNHEEPPPPAAVVDATPSVAVLPFKNISPEPGQDYFSDGLTDDIITDLSRAGSLRVIARQSTYHYKNRPFTLDDVARELEVQYIVEGSVRRAGDKLRINVQLTDVNKGQHVWAERFDTDVANVFDIQDRITRSVIEAMYVKLSDVESLSMTYQTTNNIEAYDYFLQGQQYVSNRSRESFEQAMESYKQAIKLDPDYARAYGAMAVALTLGYRDRWTDISLGEARGRAMFLANKAVELDQTSPHVYWSLGFVHLFRKEYEQAEAAARRAVELSPNYADGYGLLAFVLNWRGSGAAAAQYIKKATELNPYHTFDYPWNLGFAYYTLGRYDEAIEQLNLALERNENTLYVRLFLAASLVRKGQLDDAEWEIEQVGILRDGITLTYLGNIMPFEQQQHKSSFLADLRKAGLPE